MPYYFDPYIEVLDHTPIDRTVLIDHIHCDICESAENMVADLKEPPPCGPAEGTERRGLRICLRCLLNAAQKLIQRGVEP